MNNILSFKGEKPGKAEKPARPTGEAGRDGATDEAYCLRAAGWLAIAFADWCGCVEKRVVPADPALLAEGRRMIVDLAQYEVPQAPEEIAPDAEHLAERLDAAKLARLADLNRRMQELQVRITGSMLQAQRPPG